MKCPKCGQNVPFTGTICPSCKTRASRDRSISDFMIACLFAGTVLGGMIGGASGNGGVGMLYGGMIGLVAGFFIGCVTLIMEKPQDNTPVAPPAREPLRVPAPQVLGHALPQNAQPPSPEYEAALIASGEFRRCPQCAEVIRSAANVCRFCGHDLAV